MPNGSECLDALDPAKRAGRRLWIGIAGTALDAEARSHLDTIRPGGIVLFRRNISGREQLASLCAELRAQLGGDVRIAVDQEGGRVARLAGEATQFPANMALGAIEAATPGRGCALARRAAAVVGRELRAFGIDVNLAPVADLYSARASDVIGTRSFGADPERTAALVAAAAAGLREGGAHATLKHFPGIGDAALDPHIDLPVLARSSSESAWRPFASGIGAGARFVMTSHAILRHVDDDKPATLSAKVVRALRDELRFDGVLLTDDLEMGALGGCGDFDDIVRGAVEAGHDALLICADPARPLRARDVLREGFERGSRWLAAGAAAAEARLASVERLPAPRARDSANCSPSSLAEEGAVIARAIAEESVTLLAGDERRLAELAATGAARPPLVYLLHGDPAGIESLPAGNSSLVLCAYGSGPFEQLALARVVAGELRPCGANPAV